MKPTKKDLKKLKERIKDQKNNWCDDYFQIGYDKGLNRAITLLDELISKLEN